MAMEMSLMEGGIARLQSPGLPSKLAELGFGIGGAPRELGSVWRWGALILLAALAAYGSLIARARLLVRRLRRSRGKAAAAEQHFFSDNDSDDTCSSCSSDDGDEEEELLSSAEEAEEEEEEVVVFREGYFGDYAENDGNEQSFLRRRLPELARGGRDVVKAWDGRDLWVEDSIGGGGLWLWDLHRGEIVRSFLAGSNRVAACVTSTHPAMVPSAGDSAGGRPVEFRVWDARVGGRTPAAFAELSPRLRRGVKRFGGAGKVMYVGDGAGSAAAVDLRTVRSPLRGVAEDTATWWDGDAVVVGNGDIAGFQEVASWPTATYRSRPGLKGK